MSTIRPPQPGDLGPESGTSGLVPAEPEVSVDSVVAPETGVPDGLVRTLGLSSASGVVPLARDFTRQALYDWGWLPATTADRRAAAEDVLLVVSELVTNACLHTEGPEELRVAFRTKILRIEVADRGDGQPAPRTPHRAGRPGGHGMFIVQRLSLDWGVLKAPASRGKTVWAELAVPA